MAERASEVRTLMPCPRCGRSLLPIVADSSVAFHCKSGHDVALGDLLRTPSACLGQGLEALVAEWARQHGALMDTVEEARRNGHLDVAEIFHRHAKSLEARIGQVSKAVSRSDTGRWVRLPDAVRSLS